MLFSFSLNDSRCLTASKGEQLIVFLHKSPPDWYLCQNAHGQVWVDRSFLRSVESFLEIVFACIKEFSNKHFITILLLIISFLFLFFLCLFQHHFVFYIPQSFDRHTHHIALFQIHIRRPNESHSLRRTRKHNRSLLQRRSRR